MTQQTEHCVQHTTQNRPAPFLCVPLIYLNVLFDPPPLQHPTDPNGIWDCNRRHLSSQKATQTRKTKKLQETLRNDVLTGESLALELGGGLLVAKHTVAEGRGAGSGHRGRLHVSHHAASLELPVRVLALLRVVGRAGHACVRRQRPRLGHVTPMEKQLNRKLVWDLTEKETAPGATTAAPARMEASAARRDMDSSAALMVMAQLRLAA